VRFYLAATPSEELAAADQSMLASVMWRQYTPLSEGRLFAPLSRCRPPIEMGCPRTPVIEIL
jgi:hypothetical protein